MTGRIAQDGIGLIAARENDDDGFLAHRKSCNSRFAGEFWRR
jgi:hypothetical protein